MIKVGDEVYVDCWAHGVNCQCAPGPWRVVRINKDGWSFSQHQHKSQSMGAHVDQLVRVEDA